MERYQTRHTKMGEKKWRCAKILSFRSQNSCLNVQRQDALLRINRLQKKNRHFGKIFAIIPFYFEQFLRQKQKKGFSTVLSH